MSVAPFTLSVSVSDDSDEEQLARRVADLRREIEDTTGAEARFEQRLATEAGAKSGLVSTSELLVMVLTSGTMTAVVELVKAWALRREGRKVKFRLKLAGGEVEVEYAPGVTTEAELGRLIAAAVPALRS